MSLLVIGCAHRSRHTRRCCPGGSPSLAETLASLPELERGGEGAQRSGALRISVVLFDEACLKSRSDFAGRLERLIDGLFPRDAVHPLASIPQSALPPSESGHRVIPAATYAHALLVRPWDVMILLRGGSISAGSFVLHQPPIAGHATVGRSTGLAEVRAGVRQLVTQRGDSRRPVVRKPTVVSRPLLGCP